jgi:hypothetical protein
MAFIQKKNQLTIQSHLNIEEIFKVLEYLRSHPEITSLIFATRNANDALLEAFNHQANYSICKNLTSLDLRGCRNITDKGIEALKNLPNLTSLDLGECRNITDKGIEALKNLPNLTSLDLRECRNITDKGIEALKNLPNLTSLDLRGCGNITDKGIELIVENNLAITTLHSNYPLFSAELMKIRDAKSHPNFNMEEAVKDMIFNLAIHGNQSKAIKHILNNQEKYPFSVNSKNTNGHDLMHFFTHSPPMQKFFFEKGMIPAKEVHQDNVMRNIVQDNQSVHASEVTKRINFFTKELVNEFGNDHAKLTKAAEQYRTEVRGLFKDNADLTIDLLDLTEQEKKSVMEKIPANNAKLSSDQEFIKAVTEKAFKVLDEDYLRKNASGQYDQGYPTAALQYDWTQEAEKKITIPQSIGLVAELASSLNPNLEQMKELTATLITKRPELIEKVKLGLKLENKAAAHEHLASYSEQDIENLFKQTTGLDIEEVYKEQQKFKLAKQLYVAATTYGDNSSACIQGTWAQIIVTSEEINSSLNDKWGEYREAERVKEAQKNNITETNIMPFVEKCVKDALLKKNGLVLSNSDLKKPLLDIATAMLDVSNPEEIDKGQQQVLSEINKYFGEHIKETLPNYSREVPTSEQYTTMINQIPEVPAMQNFAENPDNYFATISPPSENVVDVLGKLYDL